MKKLLGLAFVALILSAGIISCEKDGDGDTMAPNTDSAWALLVHGNYFEENNFYELAVNGTLITPSPIAYRATDAKYRKVPAGMQTFAIIKGVDTVARIQADIVKDQYFSIYLHGNGLSTKGDIHYDNLSFPDPDRTMIYLGNIASASSKALVQAFYTPLGGGWQPINDMLTDGNFAGVAQNPYGYREFVQYFVKDYTDASMNRQLAVTPFRIVKSGQDTIIYNSMFEMRKSKAGKTVSYVMLDKGNPDEFELITIENSELK